MSEFPERKRDRRTASIARSHLVFISSSMSSVDGAADDFSHRDLPLGCQLLELRRLLLRALDLRSNHGRQDNGSIRHDGIAEPPALVLKTEATDSPVADSARRRA